MQYWSQAGQDKFALEVLDFKRNGTFVEIGAFHSQAISNTYAMETYFDWTGIGLEIEPDLALEYNTNRKSPCICTDATTVDYAALFKEHNLPKQIDYLQIDIDPAYQSLIALKALPLKEYRFSVITFEHDLYQDPEYNINIKIEQQNTLFELGYKLIADNAIEPSGNAFEDWWIDPTVIKKPDSFWEEYVPYPGFVRK